MKKKNKEILQTYRKLQREFEASESYADWIGRRLRVLSEMPENVSCNIFRRLVKDICD